MRMRLRERGKVLGDMFVAIDAAMLSYVTCPLFRGCEIWFRLALDVTVLVVCLLQRDQFKTWTTAWTEYVH